MWLSVVIPTYNEEKIIAETLRTLDAFLKKYNKEYELIVCDDGSSDHTVSIADELSKVIPQARVIRNQHKGKAHAVFQGVTSSRGALILLTDADLSTPIKELDTLLPYVVSGMDIVIASREGLQAKRVNEPFYRHLMGRVFNYLVQILALRGINDTQCGFKLLTRESAKSIFAQMRLYGANAKVLSAPAVTAYDVEMLFLARKLGFKIEEVPVEWLYRDETRVNTLRDSWRNLLDVVKVRWYDLMGYYSK